MGQHVGRAGVGARRVGAAVGAVVLALGLNVPARAADAPRWESRTAGLSVRGVTALRIAPKSDVWYASAFGNKSSRMGLVEIRDKGKTWRALRQGLDEMASERDAFEITLDPKDEKTLYVVSRGKLFRSTNAGGSFENVGAGTITFSLDRSQSRSWLAGVAVDPSNSKRLLAGTITRGYYGGLFESKDGAKSWTQIAGTGDGKYLLDSGLGHDAWPISLDKSDKFVLVGGLTGSAWLSEDRGLRFRPTQPGGPGVHRAYAMTPMASGEVFLAESRGLWRSRDRGATWGKEALLEGRCLSVDVDAGNRKQVYAVMEGQGLFRTENLTKWEGPLHADLDPHGVVVHPHAKNTVFLTSRTTGLWISTDKGTTFTSLSEKLPDAVPAITHAAAHPSDGRQMLAATDTGWVFASQDGGATWTRPGNVGAPITALVGVPGAPGTWMAAGHGVWTSTDLGAKWVPTLVPTDVEDDVRQLVRGADGTWYALWERAGEISVSKDGGKTWDAQRIEIGRSVAQRTAWASGLAVDAKDPKHLLVSLRTLGDTWSKDEKDGGPYESKDGGATWTLLDAGLRDAKGAFREGWNRGAAVAIQGAALVYLADGIGVLRMEPAADGKAPAWAEVPLTGVPAQPQVTAFVASPTPEGAELVAQLQNLTTGTRALVRSTDAGATWTTLPDPGTSLESLAVDPTMPGRYLAGDASGDRGVLVFETPGAVPPAPAVPVPAPPPVAPTPPPAVVRDRPVAGLFAYTACADKALRAVDLHHGTVAPVAGAHDGPVLSVAMAPDESRIFTGSADKSVRAFKGDDLSPMGRFEGHAGGVTALAVSADGKTVYAGDEDWKVLVWDVGTGKSTAKWEGHTAGVTALAVTADGSRVCSASRDHSVRVWDAAAGKELRNLPGNPGEVLALALSPKGDVVYAGGRDATVRAFDLATGEAKGTFATKHGAVTALALSPDGATLFVGGDGKLVEAFTTADGKAAATYELPGDVGLASIAVSRDGRWVVGGASDGVVRLWQVGKPAPAWTSGKEHGGAVFGIVLSNDVGEPVPGAAPAAPAEPAMGETPPAMGDAPPAMGDTPPPAMADTPPPAMADAPPAMGDAPAPAPAMGETPAMGDTPAPAMGEAPAPAPAMGEAPAPAPGMGETPAPPAMGG
ncbi:MAG: hypothetical protein U1E39_16775 [Planctomycetota bacterium]